MDKPSHGGQYSRSVGFLQVGTLCGDIPAKGAGFFWFGCEATGTVTRNCLGNGSFGGWWTLAFLYRALIAPMLPAMKVVFVVGVKQLLDVSCCGERVARNEETCTVQTGFRVCTPSSGTTCSGRMMWKRDPLRTSAYVAWWSARKGLLTLAPPCLHMLWYKRGGKACPWTPTAADEA